MTTLYSGINMALQAMLSHQQAIEVIEHNVANANTPGYRRQEAVLAAGLPYPSPTLVSGGFPGQMGTGVMVERIRRFNLEFFDGRFRREMGESKRWESEQGVLQQLESTMAETTSDGVVPKLDDFFQGWQALSSDPTNTALRKDLVQKSLAMTDALNWRAKSLGALQKDQDLAITQRVDEVNNIATQVASLNAEISKVKASGNAPNDLLDKRDALLDRLSEVTGAVAQTQANGEVLVSIGDQSGAHNLVVGSTAFKLDAKPNPADPNHLVQVTWDQDGQALNVSQGELAGLFDARDRVIPGQLTGLNNLASALINQVNSVQTTGYGLNKTTLGVSFFTGTTALDISVNATIQNDVTEIAAAKNPSAPGDGTNAVSMVQLKDALTMNGGTATFNGYYTGQVGQLGLEVSNANTRFNDRKLVTDSLDQLRQSASGVNLDEEAANLVKSQRAYEAATRLLTTMDDMLNRVINNMGLAGR